MSCRNPFYSEAENKKWADLYLNSKMGHKITVIKRRLALQQDVAALMACADAGIFMSRAEGWGLESFELMSMGRQVILTNYSGHTEYANTNNSYMVDIDSLELAYDGVWFQGTGGQWASINEDQIDQAVYHIRKIHTDKQNGNLKLNINGIETAKQFSWNAAASKLVNFLGGF
jgi:glycosyltransferase involved in cell wall biosynthesis